MKRSALLFATFALVCSTFTLSGADFRVLESNQFTTGDDGWRVVETTSNVSQRTGKTFAPIWSPERGIISFVGPSADKPYLWQSPFIPGHGAYDGKLVTRIRSSVISQCTVYLRGRIENKPAMIAAGSPILQERVWSEISVPLNPANWNYVVGGSGTIDPQSFMCLLRTGRFEIYPADGAALDRVKLFALQGDADITAEPPNGLNFNRVKVTDPPPGSRLTMTIKNVGAVPLIIRPGSVLNNDDDDVWSIAFADGRNCPELVAPGGSVPINVFFNPKSHKPYQFTWQIGTNDPNEATLRYTLRGQGIIDLTGTWSCDGPVQIEFLGDDRFTSRFAFPHNGDDAVLQLTGTVAGRSWVGPYSWKTPSGDVIGRGSFFFFWRYNEATDTQFLENPVFTASEGAEPSPFNMFR